MRECKHRGNQPWVVSDPQLKAVPGRETIAPHFPGSYQKKILFCCKAMPTPASGTGRHMGPRRVPAQAQSKARDTETALPLSGQQPWTEPRVTEGSRGQLQQQPQGFPHQGLTGAAARGLGPWWPSPRLWSGIIFRPSQALGDTVFCFDTQNDQIFSTKYFPTVETGRPALAGPTVGSKAKDTSHLSDCPHRSS